MQQNAKEEGDKRNLETMVIAQKAGHSVMKLVQEKENPQQR